MDIEAAAGKLRQLEEQIDALRTELTGGKETKAARDIFARLGGAADALFETRSQIEHFAGLFMSGKKGGHR